MTKNEFVALAAGKAGLSNKDMHAALDAMLAQITENLSNGQEVQFIGFGSFKPVVKPARMGRNPSTGQAIEISESCAVSFKVGAKLKESVAKTRSR